MRRLILAAPVLLLAAGCSSASTPTPASTPASPADLLRVYDATSGDSAGAAIGSTADYQAALDKVTPKCSQTASQLPAMVEATNKILIAAGIKDETGLTLLGHLSDSIPAGSGPIDCVDLLAAYATLREG